MSAVRRPIDRQHDRARKALLVSHARAVEFVDADKPIPTALLLQVAEDMATESAIAEVKTALRPRRRS